MKTTILILLLTTATMLAPPVDICITILPNDQHRISEAFGSILNLYDEQGHPRGATDAEIKQAIEYWVGTQTADYERRKNMKEYKPPPFESGSGYSVPEAAQAKPTATPKKK